MATAKFEFQRLKNEGNGTPTDRHAPLTAGMRDDTGLLSVSAHVAPALDSSLTSRPKLLVLEFWGLGDLTFATSLLRAASERYEITLVAKEHARPLLAPSFPELHFIAFDPPWTVFRNKYRLCKWPWRELGALLSQLRRHRFDAACSVRRDPRDHLMMFLSGARRRYGFPWRASGLLLTDRAHRLKWKQHRAEDWQDLGRSLGLSETEAATPHLEHRAYRSPRVDRLLEGIRAPVICLHVGARLATRRWPEPSFAQLIEQLRRFYRFHLLLLPDPDGYGADLQPCADSVVTNLSTGELVDLLGRIDLLICNDSGPGHLAAACDRPVIAIFGPTDPDWFHPWGNQNHVVIRDICPWRPCFDYCKFSEPHCLTKLSSPLVWPEIHTHIEALITHGILPGELRNSGASANRPAA